MNDRDAIQPIPHSREAEEHLLSCCFIDGYSVLNLCIQAGINPASFHFPSHQIIFELLLDLYGDQKPIELGIVAEELRLLRRLEAVGGYQGLMELTARVPTTASVPTYIGKVRDYQKLRDLIRRATGLVEACQTFNGDWDLIKPMIDRINAVTDARETDRSWPQAIDEALEATKERMKPPEQRKMAESELSWGMADLDRYFQPIENGELVVIGGYTSSGKSSLLRQVLWSAANAKQRALLETIEVRDVEEATNLAGLISQIRPRGRLDELHHREKDDLLKAFDTMRTPFLTVSCLDHDFAAMASRARSVKQKGGLRVLGVDYAQIMTDVTNSMSTSDRAAKIARLTASWKQFATKENIVVLLLAGFNRAYATENRDPVLSDLEGSSAIEKDASRVILLHIPKQYTLQGVQFTQDVTAAADEQPRFFEKVIQAKGRNSGTSSVGLWFTRETKTFSQIAR